MDNNQKNRINPIIAIAIILQIVFMIFAAVTIRNSLERKTKLPTIKIENYSAIPDGEIIGKDGEETNNQNINFNLSDGVKNDIEQVLYDAASINTKGNIANNGAKIREDSAHYLYIKNGANAYFLSFIVDISDLGQSYRFTWYYPDDTSGQVMVKESMMAFCPKKDEMIYDSFDCKDKYDGSGLDRIIYRLISSYRFDNFTTGLTGAYNGEPLKVTIKLPPGDYPPKEVAVQELSDYLSELGFSLDDFEYEAVRSKPFTLDR